MSKAPKTKHDDLRPEYEFDYSKAVRGKYYERLMREGYNVVLLDQDVDKAFSDSDSIDESPRSIRSRTKRARDRS